MDLRFKDYKNEVGAEEGFSAVIQGAGQQSIQVFNCIDVIRQDTNLGN